MDGTTVEPGQTWADDDKQSVGRKVRVDRIDGDYAICTIVADPSDPRRMKGRYNVQRPAGWSAIGHARWILLRRFKPISTGSGLIEDRMIGR
jgi:hypothetical protein